MDIALWIVLGVIVLVIIVVVFYLWSTYNSLVTLNLRVDEACSDITVQFKRRADLIPNLVETVKGYATHERRVFTRVTEARAATITATQSGDMEQMAEAENQFQAALKSIFAVAEAYPQLQASQNFLDLQAQLTDTENKIQAARRFYNGGVRQFNTKLTVFPTNFWAKTLKFSRRPFYDVPNLETIATAPRIKF